MPTCDVLWPGLTDCSMSRTLTCPIPTVFGRRAAFPLYLARLQQEVCSQRWAGPPLPHPHGGEEVWLPALRQALHAQRPPDEARPPPLGFPARHAEEASQHQQRQHHTSQLPQRLQPLRRLQPHPQPRPQPHPQPSQLALISDPVALCRLGPARLVCFRQQHLCCTVVGNLPLLVLRLLWCTILYITA